MGFKNMRTVLMILLHFTSTFAYQRIQREPALIQVILYEPNPLSGKYTTRHTDLVGYFASVGPYRSAEGDIVQIHPQSLCDASDNDQLYKYGWVGVVQLEDPSVEPPACYSVLNKAKRALEKGATAVIFDVTKYPDARNELLNAERRGVDDSPIIYMQGRHAVQLMNIVQDKQVARARIQRKIEPRADNSSDENIRMAVFMGLFFVVVVICIVCVAKFRRSGRRAEPRLPNGAQLRTRKYKRRGRRDRDRAKCAKGSDCSSMSSSASECAICLEEFSDGQVLRIIPCSHEFHKKCLDQWLKERLTCPLCNFDILHNTAHVCRSVRGASSVSSSHVSTPELRHHRAFGASATIPGFPAPICAQYPTCVQERANYQLVEPPCGYTELFCDAPAGSVPLRSTKFDAVTHLTSTHRQYLCRTSAAEGSRPFASHVQSFRARNAGVIANRHTMHRCAKSRSRQRSPFDPMYSPRVDKDGLLSSDSDLPPAYETLPACSPPQNPTIANLNINGDVITTSLPHLFRHQRCITRTPSLASGYLPDDLSDGNGSDGTFTVCAHSARNTDTSVRSVFGSSSLSDVQNIFTGSSQENLAVPAAGTDRASTPFIGYSSSDGAEGLVQLNDSSLEDALESIDIPSFRSRDLVYDSSLRSSTEHKQSLV